MAAILNAIQKVFGEDLSPDLISKVKTFSPEQFELLLSEYVDGQVGIQCPERKRGELRPFIHNYHFSNMTVPLEYGSFEVDLSSQQEDAIKKHLLYCHSLCISDPGEFVLRMAKHNKKIAAKTVENYFSFLFRIKPLLERQLITLVDDWPIGVAYFNMLTGKPLAERSRNMVQDPLNPVLMMWPPSIWQGHNPNWDDPKYVDKCKEFRQLLSEVKFQHITSEDGPLFLSRLDKSLYALEITMIADQLFEGRIDPYFPTSGDQGVFARYVKKFSSTREVPDGQLRVLSDLLRLDLPLLAELPIEEVIKIRELSDSFNEWRVALERGLERVKSLASDLNDKQREELRLIRDELQDKVNMIKKDHSGSRPAAAAKDSVTTFAIGALTAAILNPEPAISVASGAMTMALNLVVKFWRHGSSIQNNEGRHSFVRHSAIFE
ncbi:MAG: hypothetical protein NTAFB01_21340 [Nitrospira sp.]